MDEFGPGPLLWSLLDHFSGIDDPREAWRVAHPPQEVLLLVICAASHRATSEAAMDAGVRKGHRAKNMAVVPHFAIDPAAPDKKSLMLRRKIAGWGQITSKASFNLKTAVEG